MLIVGGQLLSQVTASSPQVLGYATDINVTDLFNLTNQDRANHGLSKLHLNSQLNQAAQAKAKDMFKKDYWAHVAPDGTQPWVFITRAGYTYSYAGENLAKDFATSAGVESAWMGSSEHRANVLGSHYVDVGFAVMNGTLVGGQTTLVVAFYANHPASAPVATSASTSSGTVKAETVSPTKPAPTTTKPTPKPVKPKPQPVAVKNTASGPTPIASVAAASPTDIWTNPLLAFKDLDTKSYALIGLLSLLIAVNGFRHWAFVRTHHRRGQRIWHTSHSLWQASLLGLGVIMITIGSLGVIQ